VVGLVRARFSENGAVWTLLAVVRSGARAVQMASEARMARIERRRRVAGPGTVSARYQSYEFNRFVWDNWDWSARGEEWTEDVAATRGLDPRGWKDSIVELLETYVVPGCSALEVGPGAGRWTAALLSRAGTVSVADISETCLDICRERFGEQLRCFLVGDEPAVDLPSQSVDAVWSYDVFVHINPIGCDAWLREIGRVLKPGGFAVIHHAGGVDIGVSAQWIGRSNVDAPYFKFLAEKNGLEVVEQNTRLPHKPGDVITICRA
jgi:SAM-dependent methyltransferase